MMYLFLYHKTEHYSICAFIERHVTVYHYNDMHIFAYRLQFTVTRRSFHNDKRHVTAFRPISEAAHSWSYDYFSGHGTCTCDLFTMEGLISDN